MKTVPQAVAEFLVKERRHNTEHRAKVSRLLQVVRMVSRNATVVDNDTCEVPLEDLQELDTALKEWGE